MQRSRALYVCSHLPSDVATQAGHKIAQENLRSLEQEYQVDCVLILRKGGTSPTISTADGRAAVIQLTKIQWLMGIGMGALSGIAPRLATRISLQASGLLGDLLRKSSYALIWFEFSQVFWLAPLAAKQKTDGARIVLSVHDVQGELVQRKSRIERMLFLGWTRRSEKRLLQSADSIRVLSDKDRTLVLAYVPDTSICVVPPKISAFTRQVARKQESIQAHSLLFWGAMNRPENHQAAIKFVQSSMPKLLQEFPDAVLFVIGANPPRRLLELASQHVVITGFVEDPTPYFERASLGIVPLLQGAGVKIKTLEMLSTGLTVVSTAIGAEGIAPTARLRVVPLEEMTSEITRQWTSSAQKLPD